MQGWENTPVKIIAYLVVVVVERRGGVALGLHKTNKSAPVFFNLVISPVISQCRLTGLQPASAVHRARRECVFQSSFAAHLLFHSQRETWGNQPAKAYVTHRFLLL